jgi:hypothetical protein
MPSRCGRWAAAPRLVANLSGTNIVVSWVSPSPGFVLQQVNQLNGGINGWLDAIQPAQSLDVPELAL